MAGMKNRRLSTIVIASSLLFACKSSTPTNDAGASANDGGILTDATTSTDAAATDSGSAQDSAVADSGSGSDAGADVWTQLIDGTWSLDANQEKYVCVAKTLRSDINIHGFTAVAPTGTHHTVLSLIPSGANIPDGMADCNGFTNGSHMLFGSGVGTPPMTMPDGVAVRLHAGQQILLNLHLFNTRTSAITGHSIIQIQALAASDVANEAEIVLAGKDDGLVVPGHQRSTQTGTCTFTSDQTIFAMFPHMHTMGSNMAVTANLPDGGTHELLNQPYDFSVQRYYSISPTFAMPSGGSLTIGCSYNNTEDTKMFGESTNNEMCYTGVYRYPANAGNGITCTN